MWGQMSNQVQPYFQIPKSVMSSDLSSRAKLLYGVICSYSAKAGYCYASNSHLAKVMNVTERHIQRLLSELSKANAVSVEVNRDISGTERKIQIFELDQKCPYGGDEEIHGGGDKLVQNGVTESSPHLILSLSNNKNEYYITPEDKNVLPAKQSPKTKTSVCTKTSIEPETLKKIIAHPNYGNGDHAFVGLCFQQMMDWSRAGSKRKADWAATLRNWILSERKRGFHPHSGNQKHKQKTFEQLEEDRMRQESDKFLREG